MRCLACGSKISSTQKTCGHCLRETRATQQALDACLFLFLTGAAIWYLVSDRVWMLAGLTGTVAAAIVVIVAKRRETLASGGGPHRHDANEEGDGDDAGSQDGRKLKLVEQGQHRHP